MEISTGRSYQSEYFLHDNISRSDLLNFLPGNLPSCTFRFMRLLTIDGLDCTDIILRKWVFARIQGDIIWEHQSCGVIGVREPQ